MIPLTNYDFQWARSEVVIIYLDPMGFRSLWSLDVATKHTRLHHLLELRPQGLLSRQRGANRLHQANQVLESKGNTGNASGMLVEYDGIWWNMMEYDGLNVNTMIECKLWK